MIPVMADGRWQMTRWQMAGFQFLSWQMANRQLAGFEFLPFAICHLP
jgi:hypothetical protein